ncbi:hypothetical protein [Variovorax paradoxus]|jgi:hypothetical protein|uniref:WxL domain-containing protein n=1 Tax=Variovorax paradoxus TaxID=34073 RepID=A0A679IYT9_VARPD|nr:hypothetical protein VVAX_00115 [Variovorax paradoxus]
MRNGRGPFAAVAPLCAAALVAAAHAPVRAGTATTTGLGVPASTDLKFTINIDKFVFFRLGDGAWPAVNGTVNTAAFTLAPTIPGGPTSPVTGNNTAANWNGGAPVLAVSPAAGVKLAVEVRSNGGQVALRATASTPLTSGSNTIPMSEITIASDDATLPAPPIPNAGAGTTVNVTPTSFGTLVTQRAANWTFSYANLTSRPAGLYTGQVTFTASSP